MGDIFNAIFVGPIINLLVLIYFGLSNLHLPGALGFAIIILTILIRFLVWPLMSAQLKSAKKMADLKPHLDHLKEKHKEDRQALALAQAALYKEHGINPAAGCLPILIQFPVLIALYQAILAFFDGSQGIEKVNSLLYNSSWHLTNSPDLNFLGVNLASKPADFMSIGPYLLFIPIISGLLTLIQSKMMVPKPLKDYPSDTPKEKKEKDSLEDSMMAMQSQMTYLLPVIIGYTAFQFPIALSLHWNTGTVLGIIQQYFISGWGGLEPYARKFKRNT